jgi:hypothetical protein
MFPLHFFVFKQTVSHLVTETNVEQVFSRVGQLSNVNSDPDGLTVMVSIMYLFIITYKTRVKGEEGIQWWLLIIVDTSRGKGKT